MNIIKAKNVDIENINFNNPKKYSNNKGCSINFTYNNKLCYIQTPRMVCLFGLNIYKDTNDKISSINITLQFNSQSDKINRVDNFLKKIKRLDNYVMYTASNNCKSWLNYHKKLPFEALNALYKPTLYYKKLPSNEIDYSVPPTFKIKIPYYNNKFNFTLLDETNKPIDFDLEYLEKIIVDKCIIKCIFNPSIYVVDKNFGITYKVVALQVFQNNIKVPEKQKKKDNPNKIENYFGTQNDNDDDDDDDDMKDYEF